MPLVPVQVGCEVRSDGKELKDVPATNRNELVNTPPDSKLRAELKSHYYGAKESMFGADLRYYWKSDVYMMKIADVMPVIQNPLKLRELCNKSTILYSELSARLPDGITCPPIIFPCIYKCWFRYHDKIPDMEFGKFFAHPFQITPTGPQTIPQIVKAHANLCDHAASQLESIKSGDAESCPIVRSHWQHFQLLPLCRAIIVLLDENPLPLVHKTDGTVSLDDEVQRLTTVLVLTCYDQGLSGAVSFDAIRSESLPLARQDVSAADSENVIRVSLKTAVHFIEGLQQREDRAYLSSKDGSTDRTLESKTNRTVATVDKGDEYVKDILDNPSKSEYKWDAIKFAVDIIKAKERGEYLYEGEFTHWRGKWI